MRLEGDRTRPYGVSLPFAGHEPYGVHRTKGMPSLMAVPETEAPHSPAIAPPTHNKDDYNRKPIQTREGPEGGVMGCSGLRCRLVHLAGMMETSFRLQEGSSEL